jgi:hypothetical protein
MSCRSEAIASCGFIIRSYRPAEAGLQDDKENEEITATQTQVAG